MDILTNTAPEGVLEGSGAEGNVSQIVIDQDVEHFQHSGKFLRNIPSQDSLLTAKR